MSHVVVDVLCVCGRDARGEEDVILLDLLALQDGLRLPPAVANVLHGPFGSASVFKLGEHHFFFLHERSAGFSTEIAARSLSISWGTRNCYCDPPPVTKNNSRSRSTL